MKLYPDPKIAVPKFCEENGFYTSKERAYNMSRIKGRDTKAEKLFKKTLWHAGIRYRSNQQKLPGKPDITLIKHKLVIFIDGMFWH